jgi:hypothetical protein
MAITLQIQTIRNSLVDSNTTASSFVLTLLTQHEYHSNPYTQNLLHNSRSIFSAFLEHPQSSTDAWKRASSVVKQKYGQSIRELAEKDTRWHFGAMQIKLLDFQIKDMTIKMQQLAPELWDMVGLLLSANSREAHRGISPNADGKVPMREPNALTPEEEELWNKVEDFFPGDDKRVEEDPNMKMDPNRMGCLRMLQGIGVSKGVPW